MKILMFGATGMIGQAALRQALLDPAVTEVLSVVRKPTGQQHAKLKELIHTDFTNYDVVKSQFRGYDACFFCLGTSSVGMTEDEYRRITYDFTLQAAKAYYEQNPDGIFVYISAEGADSSEQGKIMWARVRGKTENDLAKLSAKSYSIRPAAIQPLDGIEARHKFTRMAYKWGGPFIPLLKMALPRYVTDTRTLGNSMLELAKKGSSTKILSTPDVNRIGKLSRLAGKVVPR